MHGKRTADYNDAENALDLAETLLVDGGHPFGGRPSPVRAKRAWTSCSSPSPCQGVILSGGDDPHARESSGPARPLSMGGPAASGPVQRPRVNRMIEHRYMNEKNNDILPHARVA